MDGSVLAWCFIPNKNGRSLSMHVDIQVTSILSPPSKRMNSVSFYEREKARTKSGDPLLQPVSNLYVVDSLLLNCCRDNFFISKHLQSVLITGLCLLYPPRVHDSVLKEVFGLSDQQPGKKLPPPNHFFFSMTDV